MPDHYLRTAAGDSTQYRWLIAAVVLATAGLYAYAVGTAPAYLGGDEARFATAASALASTGRDLTGSRLPLFFHLPDSLTAGGGTRWYQPLLFYLMALAFRFLPFTEQSVRLPIVAIGVLDVWLIYVVARRLFGERPPAILAALLLALSPAHFLFSRQGLDYLCPLPFVLGWLWCLLAAVETGSMRLSLGSGFLLGLGFYSYIASWAMMPLLLAISWAAHLRSGVGAGARIRATTIGFAVPVLVAVVWLGLHPEMWRDIAGRYQVYDARHVAPPHRVKDFVSVYWDYFNPAYLFFAGGSNLSMATRKVGVLLLPMAMLLSAGFAECWRRRSVVGAVLVAGALAAPLPATFVAERYAIQRELVVLPFFVLIATYGAVWLLQHARRPVRVAGMLLLLAMPIQFAFFCQDYFNDYRLRSAFWFDPVNFRGVAEYLISAHAPGDTSPIYLSDDLDDVAARWRFYLVKHQRDDLLPQTSLFAASRVDARRLTTGSELVLYATDPAVPALLGGGCAIAREITDVAGGRSAIILRKGAAPQTLAPPAAAAR